jgi:voltage-gated potassium channel
VDPLTDIRRTPGTRRRLLARFLHDPRFEIFVLALIVLSVVLLIWEQVHPGNQAVEMAGHALTGLFVVELSLRFWVARKKTRFFRRYWLDILAVLPLARPLRVLRVLRLFRAGVLINRAGGRYAEMFQGQVHQLTTLASITATIVLFGALMLRFAEGGTTVHSFESAIWFSMLSMVAGEPVGVTPTTALGRFITLFLMIGGLTVFGMFVATVSAAMVTSLSTRSEVHELDLDELENHVVVCGWNRSGPTVLAELFGPGSSPDLAVVLITEAGDRPGDVPMDRVRNEYLYYVPGDYTRVEVLKKAGIENARAAVLLSDATHERSDQDTDARTVLAALTIEQMNERIFTCAELTNRQNESMLKSRGVEEIVVGEWYAGVILGSSVRNRGIVSVMDEILSVEHGNAFYTTRIPERLSGKTISELHGMLLREHEAILVSHNNGIDGTQVNPPPDRVVRAGEQIVVLARTDLAL